MEIALCLLLQGLEAKLLCSKYLMEASWSSHWVSKEKFPVTKTSQPSIWSSGKKHEKWKNKTSLPKWQQSRLLHDCFVMSARGFMQIYLLYSSASCIWNQRQIVSWLLWEEGKTNKSSKFRMDLWSTSSQVKWNTSIWHNKICNCGSFNHFTSMKYWSTW